MMNGKQSRLNFGEPRLSKETKHFIIPSSRPCGQGRREGPLLDLVVVIYATRSMGEDEKPKKLQAIIQTAIEAATARCPGGLRDRWLGIEGGWTRNWPDSKFDLSYRSYLLEKGIINDRLDERLAGRRSDNPRKRDRGAGAAAVIDLSRFFDWRQDASRVIFLLGDAYLGRIKLDGKTEKKGNEAIDFAIKTAREQGVRVFTGYANPKEDRGRAGYVRLATGTGGQAYLTPTQTIDGFQAFLEEILCQSTEQCSSVELPDVQPCFEIRWGDTAQDRIKPNDVKTLSIVASNPFANVTFKDLTISIVAVTNAAGDTVPIINGTPTVAIQPSTAISFGDLPPCNPQAAANLPGITRQVELVTTSASSGDYSVEISLAYTVELTRAETKQDDFTLKVATA